jgi:hypothetical protein
MAKKFNRVIYFVKLLRAGMAVILHFTSVTLAMVALAGTVLIFTGIPISLLVFAVITAVHGIWIPAILWFLSAIFVAIYFFGARTDPYHRLSSSAVHFSSPSYITPRIPRFSYSRFREAIKFWTALFTKEPRSPEQAEDSDRYLVSLFSLGEVQFPERAEDYDSYSRVGLEVVNDRLHRIYSELGPPPGMHDE